MNTIFILFHPSLSSLQLPPPCSYSIPSQIHTLFFCNILLHIDFFKKRISPENFNVLRICQSLSLSSRSGDEVTFLTSVATYLKIKVRKDGLF